MGSLMSYLYEVLKLSIDPVFFMLAFDSIVLIFAIRFRKTGLARGVLVSGIVLYLAGIPPVSNAFCHFLEGGYLQEKSIVGKRLDIVVVLGAGAYRGASGDPLLTERSAARLLRAVQAFRSSGAGYLVCAGKGAGALSEAESMALVAKSLGVPKERIRTEPDSRNTREHASNISAMFPDRGLKVGLVTSASHLRRSEYEFHKYYEDLTPMPSDYLYTPAAHLATNLIPSSRNLFRLSTALKEIAGLAWYRIRG